MKLVSWNVNGLRACMNKGFSDFLENCGADVVCVQETKMQREQATFDFSGYYEYWNSAEKKGYSGTAIFSKKEPLNVTYGIDIEEHDHEGRVITAEYQDFYLVCCYTPNAQRELTRLAYRMTWEDAFRKYLVDLDKKKPVVLCGDLNVAHEEIDLKNPKSNRGNAGFTDEERGKMTELLSAGFVDSFRYLYPDKENAYSWWSYMFHARDKNVGWRIDYFIVSEKLKESIKEARFIFRNNEGDVVGMATNKNGEEVFIVRKCYNNDIDFLLYNGLNYRAVNRHPRIMARYNTIHENKKYAHLHICVLFSLNLHLAKKYIIYCYIKNFKKMYIKK